MENFHDVQNAIQGEGDENQDSESTGSQSFGLSSKHDEFEEYTENEKIQERLTVYSHKDKIKDKEADDSDGEDEVKENKYEIKDADATWETYKRYFTHVLNYKMSILYVFFLLINKLIE